MEKNFQLTDSMGLLPEIRGMVREMLLERATEQQMQMTPPQREPKVEGIEIKIRQTFDTTNKTIACPVSVSPVVHITFVGLYVL